MPATLAISGELAGALRKACSDAGLRLKDDTRLSDVIAALEAMAVKCSVQDGLFVMDQQGTNVHVGLGLRNFAQKHEQFFVGAKDHPSKWDQAQKIEYLRTHSADEFAALLRKPALDAGIKPLDPGMDSASYSRLTLAEKITFCREFGEDAVRAVVGRKARVR